MHTSPSTLWSMQPNPIGNSGQPSKGFLLTLLAGSFTAQAVQECKGAYTSQPPPGRTAGPTCLAAGTGVVSVPRNSFLTTGCPLQDFSKSPRNAVALCSCCQAEAPGQMRTCWLRPCRAIFTKQDIQMSPHPGLMLSGKATPWLQTGHTALTLVRGCSQACFRVTPGCLQGCDGRDALEQAGATELLPRHSVSSLPAGCGP